MTTIDIDTRPVASQPTRFLKLAEVKLRFGVGSSTIYRWMEAGTFPRPVKLGAGVVRWPEAELDDWARNRPKVA